MIGEMKMSTMTKEESMIMFKILERADKMGIMANDRMTLSIDLGVAHKATPLDFERLLEADNFNFSHDIVGIQNHVDRERKKMDETFLPRFIKRTL